MRVAIRYVKVMLRELEGRVHGVASIPTPTTKVACIMFSPDRRLMAMSALLLRVQYNATKVSSRHVARGEIRRW